MKKVVAEKHFSGILTCLKKKENTFICDCLKIETMWKAHKTVNIGYLQGDCKRRENFFFVYPSEFDL